MAHSSYSFTAAYLHSAAVLLSNQPALPPSPASLLSNLQPLQWLMLGVLAALFVVTFVVFIYALLSLFSNWDLLDRSGILRRDNDVVDDGLPRYSGLDKSVIDSLPVLCASFPDGGGGKGTTTTTTTTEIACECAVCLSPYYHDGTEKLRLLPKCGHVFHVTCTDPWLERHSSCPLCRTKVDNVPCSTAAGVSVVLDGSYFRRLGNVEGGEAPIELVVEREPGVSSGSLKLSIGRTSSP